MIRLQSGAPMMTRVRCVLLFALLCLALCAACGSDNAGPPTGAMPDAATPTSPSDGGADGDAATDPSTCPTETSTDPLTVATTRGSVHGAAAGALTAFLGIPYAAPPVGELRFRPAAAHPCWTGAIDTTGYGAECLQRDSATNLIVGSEDCLFMNVWTPSVNASAKLPVLFWVHGGANVLGSANQQLSAASSNLYDGQALATRENAVVVSINYRLGALGFLAHPGLAAETTTNSSGNYALTDQLAGLAWVRDNIAQFGGDPAHVTLFGESAGAMNTCVLLASPLAKGLFASALMESGDCSAQPTTTALAAGTAYAQKLGCSDVACLRQVAASAVIDATPQLTTSSFGTGTDLKHGLSGSLQWAASVDGYVVPDDPMKRVLAGQVSHVPLLIGTNTEEMALFLIASTTLTCAQYESDLTTVFGADAATIEAAYPCVLDGRAAEVKAFTDLMMGCPARRIGRATASAGMPTYLYSFAHAATYGATVALGAYHASELPYVFGTFGAEAYVATPAETALSQAMQDYWGAFGRGGAPTASALPAWPAFGATSDQLVTFDAAAAVTSDDLGAGCAMWASLLGW